MLRGGKGLVPGPAVNGGGAGAVMSALYSSHQASSKSVSLQQKFSN